jgi:REP element-mobilizing transposase RayT
MHEHLRRLTRVWIEPPIYFITICTRNRRNILTHETAASVLIEEWQRAVIVGRLVATLSCLTHVHFFCRPEYEAKPCHGSSGLGRHGPAERSKKPDRSRRQRLQLRNLFGNVNSSTIFCAPVRATAKNGIMFARIPCGAVLSLPLTIGLTQVRSNDSNSNRRSLTAATGYSRPHTMATEVVRLPPMLNVRKCFAFSIWRAPACWLSC